MQGEYISGFLITSGAGIDNSLPHPPHRPGTPLPPVPPGPVDPGFGVGLPPVISNELPGVEEPPYYPTYPVKPPLIDNELPHPPTMWPNPPGKWPPEPPYYPTLPVYPPIVGGGPIPPGSVYPPLPPVVQGKILCFVWIVGFGWRWTVIDPSLVIDIGLPGNQPGIDNTLPGSGNRPSNELPPHKQPK